MFSLKALTSLLVISGAFALPSVLEKRSCSYAYLPQLTRISQANPTVSSASSTSPFYVAKDAGGKTDLVASFRNVPANAYGCQLELNYQPGHNAAVNAVAGDPTVLDVYRVSDGGNFPFPITWQNTDSRTGSLIGTFHFPSGNDLNSPTVRVIANFVCSQVTTLRFTVESATALGSVQVDEDAVSGLRISYNC